MSLGDLGDRVLEVVELDGLHEVLHAELAGLLTAHGVAREDDDGIASVFASLRNSAKGTFDAKVCAPLAPETPPELGTDATGSVAGEVAGEKFVTKKALAIVKHDKVLDGDYVAEIDFFGRDDVTCDDTPATDTKTPSLAIVDLGGASTKNDLTGTVQPTHGMFATKAWKIGKPRTTGDGWIKLDSLDFDAPLKGTFRFVTPKGGAGGAFTADVCRKVDASK